MKSSNLDRPLVAGCSRTWSKKNECICIYRTSTTQHNTPSLLQRPWCIMTQICQDSYPAYLGYIFVQQEEVEMHRPSLFQGLWSRYMGKQFVFGIFECGHWFSSVIYLADHGPHLLSMDDVRGVDDGCEAGPVHLSSVLVLSLQNRKKVNQHKFLTLI